VTAPGPGAIIKAMDLDRLAGRLLVATPALVDRNFYRTVILILDHGAEGALGVVLNRPSTTGVGEAVPEWQDLVSAPPVVFIGGPVSLTSALCLAFGDGGSTAGWQPVIGRVGILSLGGEPSELKVAVESLRVFAGYAGWSAGQLEGEIAAGGWYVVDAEPGDIATAEPQRLWRAVLARQSTRLAVVANYPVDLSVN